MRTFSTAYLHGFPVTYDWTIAQMTGGVPADVTVSCTDCPQPFIDYDRSTVQVWMSVCVSYLGVTCCDTVWLPDCLCPFPDQQAISDATCPIGDPAFNTALYAAGDTANYSYLWTADTNGIAINNPLGIADLTNPFAQTITIAVPFDVTYTLTATHRFTPTYSCSGDVDIFSSFLAFPDAMAKDTTTCAGQGVPIGSFATVGWSASWKALQGDTLELDNAQSFNPVFTPTESGIFVFEVSVSDDVTQCTVKDTATIEVIEVVADAGVDINVCNQALVQIGTAAIPDLIYAWEPTSVSDPTIAQPIDTIFANTEFRLLVTDSMGDCPQRDTIQVNVVSPPSFDAGSDVEVCEGGSIQIGNTAIAGQNYLWSPTTGLNDANSANPTVTPVLSAPSSQNYTVTITNENPGCISTDQVEVSVLAPEFIDAGVDIEVCKGDMVQIGNAGNMGTIQWNPTDYLDNPNIAQPTLTMPNSGVTSPMTYTITIDYPSGCQQQDEVTITPIMATADAGVDQTQCVGEMVELGTTAQAGYTYLWSPTTGLTNSTVAMTNAEPNVTTTYTLTATSPDGCVATDMVTVIYQSVTADAGSDATVCPSNGAESIGSAAQIGFTYEWTPAAGLSAANISMPTATVTTEADYILTVTHNTTGCLAKDTVKVSPEFGLDLGNDLSICPMEETTIGIPDPVDGTTFSWSPGGQSTSMITITPSSTTTYTLTATKAGCIISDDIKINVKENPTANAGNSTVICQDACIQIGITAEFGKSYSWYPSTGLSDGTISNPIACPTETTTYTMTVVDNLTGCIAESSITIGVSPIPAPPVDAGIDQNICPGASVTIGANAQGGYTYAWNPTTYLSNPFIAQPLFSPPSSPAPSIFTYYLTMTDNSTGCYKEDTVTINLYRNPSEPLVSDVELCEGSSVELCSSCEEIAGHTYLWSPMTSLDDPTKLNAIASPTVTTFYTLVVTETATTCSSTVFVEATVNTDPAPTADAGNDQQTCENTTVNIGSSDLGDTYFWGPTDLVANMSPNNTSSQISFTPPDTGNYTLTLTVTNVNSCTNTDEITIISLPEVIAYAGVDHYICTNEFNLAASSTNYGTGTWSYESGPGTPNFVDANNPNTLVTGLTSGTHTFKWTITGSDICNAGTFDYVTLIYEDPEIEVAKNKCQLLLQNYDVIVLIENGSLYSVNDGIVGMINDYTSIFSIDTSTQLQVIAVSNGNCRDTAMVIPPNCIDCSVDVCLPITGEVKKGSKE